MTKKKAHPNIKDVKLPKNWGKMADGSVFGETPEKKCRCQTIKGMSQAHTFNCVFKLVNGKPKKTVRSVKVSAFTCEWCGECEKCCQTEPCKGRNKYFSCDEHITPPPNKGKKGGNK